MSSRHIHELWPIAARSFTGAFAHTRRWCAKGLGIALARGEAAFVSRPPVACFPYLYLYTRAAKHVALMALWVALPQR